MKDNDEINPRQAKRSAFTVMNNVRDLCEQSDPKKVLMFTLGTYCDGDGICYPSNDTLAAVTRKSERTIRRMLNDLVAEGEVEKLTSGVGRDQKRILRLSRYAKPDKAMTGKPDKAMTPLNRTASLGKTSPNSHGEQPRVTAKGKGVVAHKSSEPRTSNFSPKVRYPDSEEEMHGMLERLGIECEPDYDGNFFAQMEASDWTIHGKPVWDWPEAYKARLERTCPGY